MGALVIWRETPLAIGTGRLPRKRYPKSVSHGPIVSGTLKSVNPREWMRYPPELQGRDRMGKVNRGFGSNLSSLIVSEDLLSARRRNVPRG